MLDAAPPCSVGQLSQYNQAVCSDHQVAGGGGGGQTQGSQQLHTIGYTYIILTCSVYQGVLDSGFPGYKCT